MFDTKKFGAYLAAKRKYMGMKQSELAKKVNLTRQSISKYETGESFPDISVIIQFAEIFGVTIDELIKSGLPP
jgi:Predicted transcriptional regulators